MLPQSHCTDQGLAIHIFGLLMHCPFGVETETCVLKTFRDKNSLEAKFRFAEAMAVDQHLCEDIQRCHNRCFQERLNSLSSDQKRLKYMTREGISGGMEEVAMS